MAFDSSQPLSSTKIRDLATVIPANWTAILRADSSFVPYASNFANRNTINTANPAIPINPVNLSDGFIIYCKQDGSGTPQLYFMTQTGVTTQITKGQYLGSATTQIYTGGITFNGTAFNSQQNFVSGWGFVNSAGVVQGSGGIIGAISRLGTGNYQILLSGSSANYSVVATAYNNSSSNLRVINITNKASGSFTLEIRRADNQQLRDEDFSFIVCGAI